MKNHIRSREEIELDYKKWFKLVQTDKSIFSWSMLAQKLGVSRTKVITSFNYHPYAKKICEDIFSERLEEAIIIVDDTVLMENYDELLSYHLLVPSPVFRKIKFSMVDANATAGKLFKLITTLRTTCKEYDPSLKKKVKKDCWWAKIENVDLEELPIEPSFNITASQRSVINLALYHMQFGDNVLVFTSSYKLMKIMKLQCDSSLPYNKQIHIHFKFYPPRSSFS